MAHKNIFVGVQSEFCTCIVCPYICNANRDFFLTTFNNTRSKYKMSCHLVTKINVLTCHENCGIINYSKWTMWEMKWNESGFRPPLCTYRLNWARRTSWGWWDDWDDTVLQTQDSKFAPWRSEAEHATSRSRRLHTILTFTRGWGSSIFRFFQTAETGNRIPNSGMKGSGANHYPRAPARTIWEKWAG